MTNNHSQEDINILKKLYFKQPRVLFQHLFGSYYQLVNEIIPQSLDVENNYFYESVSNDALYLHGFKCSNISIKPPTHPNSNELLSPMQARKKHLKYSGTIVADVIQITKKEDFITGEITVKEVGDVHEKVEIGSIPIMVKSEFCTTTIKKDLLGECKYDPGGYFIVKGKEKVIISIEQMIDNKILVFNKNDSSFEGGYEYTAQINSKDNNWSDNLQIINIKNKKKGELCISIYNAQLVDIPIFVLFRAMGLESDKDIISNITYNIDDVKMINLLRESIENSVDDKGNPIKTKEEAVNYLITKLKRNKRISQNNEEIALIQKRMYLNKVLSKDFFPHLGNDINKNIRFLGLMINKLLNTMLGRRPLDDRDNYDNKRVETPGVLIGQLFRQSWKKMLTEIGMNFKKKNNSDDNPIIVVNQIKQEVIEESIKKAMATGIWGMNKPKKGVAQSMLRTSWALVLNNLRKVMSPSLEDATSKITSIRHVNSLSFGYICPVETPEGQKIGINKSLTVMATITTQNIYQRDVIVELIKEFKKNHIIQHPYDVNPLELNEWGKVFLCGEWYSVTKDLFELYSFLIQKRQEGIIDSYTTIILDYEEKEINIYYDGGRLIRPLLNVKNNKLLLTPEIMSEAKKLLDDKSNTKGWKILTNKYNNIVSYEDIDSSKYIMIAEDINNMNDSINNKNREIVNDTNVINRYGDYRYINYTHCQFDKWTNLGTLASSIPFANHNQAKQNIINFSQVKQGIGMYVTNYKDRMDIAQVLYHPQVPLCITEGMKYNNFINQPNGENVIVAIMSYTGYNIEDSLIFNQAAIDRGIFRVDTLKTYTSEVTKNPSTSQDDVFTKPDRNKVTGMRSANYEKLQEDGSLNEETEIDNNDAIIGKISPILPTGKENKVYSDSSEIYKNNVPGVINRVHKFYNNEGYETMNVSVRMERTPIIADKFASRYGQKGTIGIALPQRDMPFTESGIIPDLIMNPHSIPTRMTMGQLLETITGKIGAEEGKYIDATPFNNYDVKNIPETMKKLGFNEYGTEKMYCGITGQEIETQIFIGPVYYMRLKHMVLDKIHGRARGPKQALVRQPLEGRTRAGGLRIGWMEKDSMLAHGAGQFLKERLVECSDLETFNICDDCGMIVSKVKDKNYYVCEPCNNYTRISQVNLPYGTKLLFQELMSVNVMPKIKVKEDKYS